MFRAYRYIKDFFFLSQVHVVRLEILVLLVQLVSMVHLGRKATLDLLVSLVSKARFT